MGRPSLPNDGPGSVGSTEWDVDGITLHGEPDLDAGSQGNVEYGRLMDVLSEGPIHGLVDGLKSVYLSETVVKNANNSLNFTGVIFQMTKGTKTQVPLFGFPETETEVPINGGAGVKVSIALGPATRQITTPGLTHLRLRISCPSLKFINQTTGSSGGSTATVKVEVWSDVSPVTQVTLDNGGIIWGEFDSRYTRSYKIKLPPMLTGGWFVRVTRVSADAPDTFTQNDTYWMSYTEIVEGTFSHPWSAKVGLMVDSRQFKSIPSRAYDVDGRIIKIPTNYTPAIYNAGTGLWTAGSYSGNWDGTFKDAPTVCYNPAWQFYDLSTNTRYGAGKYLDINKLDKWALYSIGKTCDDMVSDGFGNQEPRFATSIYLSKQEDAIKVLTNMAAAFRGMLYYNNGMLVPSQDVDKSVWAIFTNSNVIDGVFKYSGTARKARHTTCMVSFNDPKAGYALTPVLVEDQAATKKFGIQQLDVVHVGCTSYGGAVRFGQWALISEQTETDTCEFNTALESVAIAPGRIIQVNDQFRSGQARNGGRVLAGATTTSIPLDGSVTLLAGHSYTLRLALPTVTTSTRPDGTTINEEGVKIEQVAVTSPAGTYTTLACAALSVAPQAFAQWLLSDGSITPQLFKVISIKENTNDYTVVCLEHNPNKFALADTLGVLDTQTSLVATAWPSISAISISSSYRVVDGSQFVFKLVATWNPPATGFPVAYRAFVSFDNGKWQPMSVSGASAFFDYAAVGPCKIRVIADYTSGVSSPYESAYTIVNWTTTTPSTITMVVSSTEPV